MASFKFFVCLLCFSLVVLSSGIKPRTLILVDDWSLRDTHSIFFRSLKEKGFDLTFKLADDATLNLSKYGEFLYDNLLIFAPTVEEFGGTLNAGAVTDFVDAGGNLFLAASSDVSELIREIATEVGVELDEKDTAVIDHMAYDGKDCGKHTRLAISPDNLINAPKIAGKIGQLPILYQGVGMVSDPTNPLVLDVLHGSTTAYSFSPDDEVLEYPHAVGKATLLVTALQARNNARVVVTGSLSMFSDEFFSTNIQLPSGKKFDQTGNAALASALSSWCFHEQGVLRLSNIRHHLTKDKTTPMAYTIMEEVEFLVTIEELVGGKWQPYDGTDVQLEFVRIDPFVRTFLKRKGKDYVAVFKVPDVYGVFQFKINHNRIGYTRLTSATQVSVKPLLHTQYERFIVSAFPYYTASFSMMAGVVIFSFIFLHFKEPDSKSKSD